MYNYLENNGKLYTEKLIGKVIIARCRMNIEDNIWTISSWFVAEKFQHQGHGRSTLITSAKYLFEKHGKPAEIRYVWNGENAYVLEWLEKHFNAKCLMDVAAMKYKAEDCWEAHVYVLDKEKFFKYCNLV